MYRAGSNDCKFIASLILNWESVTIACFDQSNNVRYNILVSPSLVQPLVLLPGRGRKRPLEERDPLLPHHHQGQLVILMSQTAELLPVRNKRSHCVNMEPSATRPVLDIGSSLTTHGMRLGHTGWSVPTSKWRMWVKDNLSAIAFFPPTPNLLLKSHSLVSASSCIIHACNFHPLPSTP